MHANDAPEALIEWIGQAIVVDLRSPYVCLGTLLAIDNDFLRMADADLHDFRDSQATRETYVYDSARLGIRRNRAMVLVRRSEVVSVSRLADISET